MTKTVREVLRIALPLAIPSEIDDEHERYDDRKDKEEDFPSAHGSLPSMHPNRRHDAKGGEGSRVSPAELK